MIAVVLAAAITSAPLTYTQPHLNVQSKTYKRTVTRLRAHIIARHTNATHRAKVTLYAGQLARAIVVEAKRNGIPITTLAAIGWAESHYRRWVKGTSYEYGVWQLWPYSSGIKRAWETLRKQKRIGTHPDRSWRKLGYKGRKLVLGDVVVSTALAALVLRRILSWCKRNHLVKRYRGLGSRGHKYGIDRAAHYNSGRAWPKRGYQAKLRLYSRRLQRTLYAP